MPINIALLEDEDAQAQLIQSWLQAQGYSCEVFAKGQALLTQLSQAQYDLLLIDWELPDISGPDVMQSIRTELHIETPIIFVTNRDSEADIVTALCAGADDYLIKPLRQMEFMARIDAHTRRIDKPELAEREEFSPYIFNLRTQQVSLHNESFDLSGKEFELAYYLFRNEGRLLERKQILSDVWQQQAELNTRTVDTHISTLRKKLALSPANGWRLKSIYGHGYRLERMADN